MALNREDYILYRNLLTVLSDSKVGPTIAKFAEIQYNLAISSLRNAKDMNAVSYLQAKAGVWEHIMNLKPYLTKVISSAG